MEQTRLSRIRDGLRERCSPEQGWAARGGQDQLSEMR